MGQFRYQARGAQGESLHGVLSAASPAEVAKQLRANGHFVVAIEAVVNGRPGSGSVVPEYRGRRVRRREVIFFAHQLAAMIDTGVPISEALDGLVERCQSEPFRAVLIDVQRTVQGGGELSAAIRRYPDVFPPVMIGLIRAGEVSGTLGRMLDRISEYLDKEMQILRRAKAAMMYPVFMLGMTLVVTAFILTVVLPRFAKIYATRDAALPVPTQILMAAHRLMTTHWYVCVGVAALVVGAAWAAPRTGVGRRAIDWCKLHAPVVGGLFTRLYLTRATRTMGTMLAAGVPLLDSVGIVRHVTTNVFFDELWDRVDMRLREGAQLSDPLFASALIPRSISQMIYSGERSGRLSQAMARIAAFTESEFDDAVKSATQFIEPVMVVVMGTIVGFVAIALLMPIFSVGRVLAG